MTAVTGAANVLLLSGFTGQASMIKFKTDFILENTTVTVEIQAKVFSFPLHICIFNK